jgi:hypothetical protein
VRAINVLIGWHLVELRRHAGPYRLGYGHVHA